MRLFILTLFLVVSAVNVSFAADDMAARLEAAKAYEKIVPVEKMTRDMLNEFKKNPQIALTDEELDKIAGAYDYEAMRKTVTEGIAKHFTVEEINKLVAFYGDPVGQSIMKKMPVYMSEVMPEVQKQVVSALLPIIQEKAAKQQAEQEKAEKGKGE